MRVLFFLLLLFCSSFVHSATIPITGVMCGPGGAVYSTPAASCAAGTIPPNYTGTKIVVTVNGTGLTFGCMTAPVSAPTVFNHTYRSSTCSSGYTTQCSSPDTWDSTYSVCTSFQCPSGQYKNASNQCIAEPVCAVGQYVDKTNATNHVCSPVPDCNASSPGGGNYFDMATGQCKTDPNLVICISGSSVSEKWCPPISDCKPSGYICSNDAITVAIGQEDKAAAVAAAKQRADAAAAQAATAAGQAAAAAAAKVAAKVAAAAATAAAKADLDAVIANAASTQAQKSAAAQAYGKALDAQTAANAAADNSGTASGTVAGHAADAQAAAGSIPGGTPTSSHAGAAADTAEGALAAALGALSDAIAGIGSTPDGTEQQACDGCAQESTLQGIGDKLTVEGGGAGSSETAELPDSFYEPRYPDGVAGVWSDNKQALLSTPIFSAVNQLLPTSIDSGSCPSWQLPVPGIHGSTTAELSVSCTVWSSIRLILICTAVFTARQIIFG